MLAGLLYLGSGVGLGIITLIRSRTPEAQRPKYISGRVLLFLVGAVAAGGIAGPILLMAALSRVNASTASLLLNLEGAFTVLLARFFFP